MIELTLRPHRHFEDKNRLRIGVFIEKYKVPLNGLICTDFVFEQNGKPYYAFACVEEYDGSYDLWFENGLPNVACVVRDEYKCNRTII